MEQRCIGIVCSSDQRRRNQLGQRFSETAIANQAELGQHLVEPGSRLRRDAARAVEGAPVDGPAVDEARAEFGDQIARIPSTWRSDGLEGHYMAISRASAAARGIE